MDRKEKDVWLQEFAEFSGEQASNIEAPAFLLENVRSRLFPNPWRVFAKIAALHGVVGFLSLGVCNQFGLNPFNTTYSLSELFMKTAGHHFCMVACGLLFVATTYILANMFLTLEELESVQQFEWLQLGVLSLASIAAFYFFGAELVGTFVGLWLFGAFIGGLLSIEGSLRWRRQISA